MRSLSAPRRRWPVLLLIISAVVAFAVTAAGETNGVLALAYTWVLSCAALVGLARRADHGLPVGRAATVAAAASGVCGVLLLLLADQTRQSLLLLAVAVGFCAAVLLLGVWLVLAGLSDPPAWLRSDDGLAVPARQRLGCALRHTAKLARQHPHRSPARVLSHAQRDMNRMVWRIAPAQACAFSHFEVTLHPRTLERLDAWLPVEHLARELALGYAEAHRDLPGRSNHVVVHIAADQAVPLGAAVIAGSFVEPRLQSPTAKAWARLHGLPDEHGLDGAYRFPAAVDPDRTRVLAAPRTDPDGAAGPAAGPDPDRTAVLVAPHRPVAPLMLRACGADGAVDAAAPAHTLQFPGPWRIGRAPEADIRFAAQHVSRLHAEVFELDGGWGIVDRSARGTLVNGRPLDKDRPQPLRSGDIVELGRGSEPRVLLRVG